MLAAGIRTRIRLPGSSQRRLPSSIAFPFSTPKRSSKIRISEVPVRVTETGDCGLEACGSPNRTSADCPATWRNCVSPTTLPSSKPYCSVRVRTDSRIANLMLRAGGSEANVYYEFTGARLLRLADDAVDKKRKRNLAGTQRKIRDSKCLRCD